MDQTPFDSLSFAENPEPRCACLLLLDTSGSMSGRPIQELNAGLATFKEELVADPLAAKRVEIGIVTFGGEVERVCEFTSIDAFVPPMLAANGGTPMGSAIETAIQMVQDRKQTYKANGIGYYRPWIFMITDGAPTDYWRGAAEQVRNEERRSAFSFFGVGVENADFDVLQQISVREPLRLQGLRFRDLFIWLSASQKRVSQSRLGASISLPPPGWAELQA